MIGNANAIQALPSSDASISLEEAIFLIRKISSSDNFMVKDFSRFGGIIKTSV